MRNIRPTPFLGVLLAIALVYFWPQSKDADQVVLGYPHENVSYENVLRVHEHSDGVDFTTPEGQRVSFKGPYRVVYKKSDGG